MYCMLIEKHTTIKMNDPRRMASIAAEARATGQPLDAIVKLEIERERKARVESGGKKEKKRQEGQEGQEQGRESANNAQVDREAIRRFFFALEDGILDFKRNSAVKVESALLSMRRLLERQLSVYSLDASTTAHSTGCSNSLTIHPRTCSELTDVLGIKGGEQALTSVGWRPIVSVFERHYVVDKRKGNRATAEEALRLVSKAIDTVRAKATLGRKAKEIATAEESKRKEKVLRDFEEDKVARKKREGAQ